MVLYYEQKNIFPGLKIIPKKYFSDCSNSKDKKDNISYQYYALVC